MSDRAGCRTAPATPGLLNIQKVKKAQKNYIDRKKSINQFYFKPKNIYVYIFIYQNPFLFFSQFKKSAIFYQMTSLQIVSEAKANLIQSSYYFQSVFKLYIFSFNLFSLCKLPFLAVKFFFTLEQSYLPKNSSIYLPDPVQQELFYKQCCQ